MSTHGIKESEDRMKNVICSGFCDKDFQLIRRNVLSLCLTSIRKWMRHNPLCHVNSQYKIRENLHVRSVSSAVRVQKVPVKVQLRALSALSCSASFECLWVQRQLVNPSTETGRVRFNNFEVWGFSTISVFILRESAKWWWTQVKNNRKIIKQQEEII